MEVLRCVAAAVAAVTLPAPLWAECVCEASQEPQALLDAADVVFRGTLQALSEDWDGEIGTARWNYALRVDEVYRGAVEERVSVSAPSPHGDGCSVDIVYDTAFLVYAKRKNDYGEYRSDRCMGTKPIAQAAADLALLGEGYPPEPFSCAAGVGSRRGIGLLLTVALLWSARRRSRH